MKSILTPALIERCHAGSRAKGFWEQVPPQGQQLMLVISELCESLEAHRKGKRANMKGYSSEYTNLKDSGDLETNYGRSRLAGEFVSCVKDSVEDELADAYIRLCDFIGGFKVNIGDAQGAITFADTQLLPENFATALLIISNLVIDAHRENEYNTGDEGRVQGQFIVGAMRLIERLAEREEIDLARHIDLKLAYNSQRPAKHGKDY